MFNSLIRKLIPFGNDRGNSLSVPVFDGAFRPNNLLEGARVLVEKSDLEDLAVNSKGQLFAACGRAVYEVSAEGELSEFAVFESDVTALTVLSDDSIAVGLGTKVIIGVGKGSEHSIEGTEGVPFVAITAITGQADGQVLICDGSDKYACSDWAWDLMSKNKSGRLVQYSPETKTATVLASGLASAFGVFDDANHGPLVSESWAHAVTNVSRQKTAHIIDHLPGYPGRFAAADNGGFWLTMFCSRTQLVEFVLKENDFRQEMMQTIDQKYWISPTFGSGSDFLEPLQGGGVKQMGFLKPWAPPRSYGLVVRFDADLTPQYSLHSRVGGRHHGICAAAQVGDMLYLLSKGAGCILKLSVAETQAELSGKDVA